MRIRQIPILMDNYAHLLVCESTNRAGIVDPAQPDVVAKAMSKSPNSRYANAGEFVAAFRRAVRGSSEASRTRTSSRLPRSALDRYGPRRWRPCQS